MSGFLFFLTGVLTLAAFYAILAMLLNLVAGWGGMWDLGVAGLVAVGAYTYVLTTQDVSPEGAVAFAPALPMPLGIVCAALATALAALLIGLPTLRLRGEFFLITTLAFAEVVRQLALNARTITQGPSGFSGLARPFESLVEGRNYRFVLLGITVALAVAVYGLVRRLSNAPFGRLMRGLRDNESVAISLGKNVTHHRLVAYVFTGLLIGAVAPVYIWYVRGIVPSLFASDFTFVVWTALVIGGIGSRRGPIIGAVMLIALTEMLAFIQVDAQYAQLLATSRPIILGIVLILVMRFRPMGLVTEEHAFRGAASNYARAVGERVNPNQSAAAKVAP